MCQFLYSRNPLVIAHAIAQDLLSAAEKGSPLSHALHANWDYYIKATKKFNTVPHSLLFLDIEVSILLLTKTSTPSPIITRTISSSRAYPQPRDAMYKNPQQVFLTATPTTDLRPYDKIRTHLHRLHSRIKASVNRD